MVSRLDRLDFTFLQPQLQQGMHMHMHSLIFLGLFRSIYRQLHAYYNSIYIRHVLAVLPITGYQCTLVYYFTLSNAR